MDLSVCVAAHSPKRTSDTTKPTLDSQDKNKIGPYYLPKHMVTTKKKDSH